MLDILIQSDEKIIELRDKLIIKESWTERDFESTRMRVKDHPFNITISNECISNVKTDLEENVNFLIQLLENPVILEHDSFTELLQAVFHVMDELERRKKFDVLPPADYKHLKGDFQRVYKQLVISWLSYMQYLKRKYPYLFSLAVRTNPFDESANVIIR